ncbi:MAG TPA: DUF2380 domain-containing protein [Archangium sp.]|uniref:DUF2380 domain-containing protein n=1 Tax=Archangium sp. TaxID=1872627 RepID=UPI002E35A2A6|nr:DUF2380 domain-containing protein [Archangium sp.]HEX5752668.1 DUF2380 domain-containing protein [Archangium sp.]
MTGWREPTRLEVTTLGLLLVLALSSTGCASLTPPPGRGMKLHYSHGEAAAPLEPVGPQWLHHGQGLRGSTEGTARGSTLAAHLAFRGALSDVAGTTRRLSGELSKLEKSHWGIAGKGAGLFLPHVGYGQSQLRWMEAELAAATRLADAASEVEDEDMRLALLRLAGPRLEAAMLGSLVLAAWVDVLHLLDVAFKHGYNSLETLFVEMDRWQKMLEPAMTALASQEPGQLKAAAQDMPLLMGHLSGEFNATAQRLHSGLRNIQKVMALAQLVEMVTMVSAMKFSLPRLGPSAPATLGMGMMMGGDGVMMGTRIVVSAEWVEMMRRLVRAGVISLPAVSAAVRIQAGQVLMAEAHDELPHGVREALGDGPEVRGMRVTDRAGAGMAEPPGHHVLPKEFREWFEKRGFTGEMSIDHFCVRLEQAHHQAIHGGGNWKLGRTWPGEWNRMIMETLRKAEARAGRMLTPTEVLGTVAKRMTDYGIQMDFIRWRGP